MALIVDFLLLAATGAACFYCWVLSKRLKALTNNEAGISTGIEALSKSAEEVQSVITATKEETQSAADDLKTLIALSEKKSELLESLIKQVPVVAANAVDETEIAAKHLVSSLTPQIEAAREAANKLLDSMEKSGAEIIEPEPKKKEPAAPKKAEQDDEIDVIDGDDDIGFVDGEDTGDAQGEAA